MYYYEFFKMMYHELVIITSSGSIFWSTMIFSDTSIYISLRQSEKVFGAKYLHQKILLHSKVHDTSFKKIYSNTLEFIILYILYIKILLIINYQQEFSEHLCARPKGDHGFWPQAWVKAGAVAQRRDASSLGSLASEPRQLRPAPWSLCSL